MSVLPLSICVCYLTDYPIKIDNIIFQAIIIFNYFVLVYTLPHNICQMSVANFAHTIEFSVFFSIDRVTVNDSITLDNCFLYTF